MPISGRSLSVSVFVLANLAGCTGEPRRQQELAVPDSVLERGAYLVEAVASCAGCHTPMDSLGQPIPSMRLAGGLEIPEAFGTWRSPNITPDQETGIGHYTEEQIVAAITTMVKSDGSPIQGPMTYSQSAWSQIDPDDAMAVALYLKSLAPISNRVPESTFEPNPPTGGE